MERDWFMAMKCNKNLIMTIIIITIKPHNTINNTNYFRCDLELALINVKIVSCDVYNRP